MPTQEGRARVILSHGLILSVCSTVCTSPLVWVCSRNTSTDPSRRFALCDSSFTSSRLPSGPKKSPTSPKPMSASSWATSSAVTWRRSDRFAWARWMAWAMSGFVQSLGRCSSPSSCCSRLESPPAWGWDHSGVPEQSAVVAGSSGLSAVFFLTQFANPFCLVIAPRGGTTQSLWSRRTGLEPLGCLITNRGRTLPFGASGLEPGATKLSVGLTSA